MTDDTCQATGVLIEETFERVRILRLNRPKRKNALNDELGWAIVDAIDRAASDDEIRVIGITGEGDAFCSGADLSATDSSERQPASNEVADDLGWIGRFPLRIRIACDKPVVAGINGVAVGAGLALCMCADMRIASTAARFHPGYSRAATSPDGGLSWTLPQTFGHERAMRFLLEGEMLDAQSALALGLVGELVSEEGFAERFSSYCQQLALVAPIAAQQTKRLLTRSGLPLDIEERLRDELVYVKRGLQSEDGREAVNAIMEKRQPNFTGS